jgi:hypothetical protein
MAEIVLLYEISEELFRVDIIPRLISKIQGFEDGTGRSYLSLSSLIDRASLTLP